MDNKIQEKNKKKVENFNKINKNTICTFSQQKNNNYDTLIETSDNKKIFCDKKFLSQISVHYYQILHSSDNNYYNISNKGNTEHKLLNQLNLKITFTEKQMLKIIKFYEGIRVEFKTIEEIVEYYIISWHNFFIDLNSYLLIKLLIRQEINNKDLIYLRKIIKTHTELDKLYNSFYDGENFIIQSCDKYGKVQDNNIN
jgi:hypothetical protein